MNQMIDGGKMAARKKGAQAKGHAISSRLCSVHCDLKVQREICMAMLDSYTYPGILTVLTDTQKTFNNRRKLYHN
jgi:hypothetical protein